MLLISKFFSANQAKFIISIMTNKIFSQYPSQMDISFSENCNLACKYCFVKKTNSAILDLPSVQKAVDIFFSFPPKKKTITFTTCEPFLDQELFKQSITYILRKSKNRDFQLQIVATTNGTLLNDKTITFLNKYLNDKFILNIGLDGAKKSNDAYRIFKTDHTKSVFADSWKNFKKLPRQKVRVISTITPSEVSSLGENTKFFLKNGFENIDFFPQIFTFWSKDNLKKLSAELTYIIECFNDKTTYNGELRLLNRLWGRSDYRSILFSGDRKFYLFEWVLPLPHKAREEYIIGDIDTGLNLKKRKSIFLKLFSEFSKKSNQCMQCDINDFCSYPLPLYLWSQYYKKDFNKYFDNFCNVARTMVNLSKKIKSQDKTDREKWTHAKKTNK